MGDIVVLFLLQNIVVFSFIFWGLTWIGEYFFKKKNHDSKKKFYECGFKSTTDINIQINLNFSILCVFLILYDIEFTFLVPILINFTYTSFLEYFILSMFILIILLSLIYDWQMNALNWQY